MTQNRLMLASESPLRIGGVQFALCAAEESFETAEWIENRRKKDAPNHTNGSEARRSMAHHHCGMGLEFAFKVLYALEIFARDGSDDEKWTRHGLGKALAKITIRDAELRALYTTHCAGRLQPVAICVGRHPEYVEKANLDTLDGFCRYVDQLGKWERARYDHWQSPGVWMYRVADLEPVLTFGKAALVLANQAQEPVALRLVNDEDEIHLSGDWTQTPVEKERTRAPQFQVVLSAVPQSSITESSSDGGRSGER